MGRSNPTYRNRLDDLMSRFERFRDGLREESRDAFDRLWEHAHGHAHAASYMNTRRPGTVAVFSMLLGMQRQLDRIESRLEEIEREIEF